MKALSLKISNIYLLSILFVPRYISAAVRKPQRRQNYSPSGLLITPASTTTLTIADKAGPDTVALDPTAEESITSITGFSTSFEAPDGPTAGSVGTATLTALTTYSIKSQDNHPIVTTTSIIMQSVNPLPSGEPSLASFTAPTTYSIKPQDDHSISTTGSIVMQSVTPTTVSTVSFTIESLTPAATSTASAAGTSGVRSVGSKHTWSAILFLPWLAAMLSI